MAQKSISDLIFENLSEKINNDVSFNDISNDLIPLLKEEKIAQAKIERLLAKEQNEHTAT